MMKLRLLHCNGAARAAPVPRGVGEKRPPRGGAGRALPVHAHGRKDPTDAIKVKTNGWA